MKKYFSLIQRTVTGKSFRHRTKKRRPKRPPSILQSVAPILVLMGLIGLNVTLLGSDTLSGANQLSLILAAGVAAALALYNGTRWNELMQGVLHTLNSSMPAILILFMIGMLSGAWMLSGVIPAMIHYGLNILRPEFFLPATVVISAVISVSTGSSWSTIATVGVALIGIGKALGFGEAVVAGAIISGAYFGDKVSPLSDTTNLAAATTDTPLFTHIGYMLYTTVPSILLTLLFFTGITFFSGSSGHPAGVEEVQRAIGTTYRITPWLFAVPVLVLVLIARKTAPIPALLLGSLAGIVFALLFQQPLISGLAGTEHVSAGRLYALLTRSLYGNLEIVTGNAAVDSLFATRGMAGMMNTVWLIVTAMVFGGIMEAGHFLERLTGAIVRRVRRTGALVTTTASTCILFNLTTADQYMSIVIPGRMFRQAYRRQGLKPEVLSRTLEDSATVTSVLIPWNSCGATQAGVLGVATLAYLPFTFFCYVSPLMSILFAWFHIRIRRLPQGESALEAKES